MSLRKSWMIVMLVAAVGSGWLLHQWTGSKGSPVDERSASEGVSGPCAGGVAPLYWKAPMDPSYVRKEPGKSPMGMDLVPVCPEASGKPGAGGIYIDPVFVQNMGVREARVERRTLSRSIRAVGRVGYDEQMVAHVHTKVQGWVEKLHIDYEGQMVERGQPLLEIYSPELVATQEELLVAAHYRDETSTSPFPDVVRGGLGLFDATRRRLELWDIPDRDVDQLLKTESIHKLLTLYSPATGAVTNLMVREGMEVGPNQNLYTIADLSRVWVYADVYEYELPWIEVGQKGVIELGYIPGRTFEGVITYVYPYLDPKTRTIRVRLEIDNSHGLLKPEMFANVRIESQTRRDVLAVPDEAVIRSGTRSLVIVALGEGRFDPREVTTGIESGDGWIEVLTGLDAGEQIVSSGQFLIDSESRLREAAQNFLEPEALPKARDERGLSAPPEASTHSGHEMPAMDSAPAGGPAEPRETPGAPDTSGAVSPGAGG
jgi:multidrug efflux pump subunit AcrA (membrane-fusion protein)